MARQNTVFQNFRILAGGAFIGLGASILFRNMTEAASQLTHLLGITADGADALGVLAAGALAASNVSQAYLFDHNEFLRTIYLVLLSFWPLLLFVAGALLMQVGLTGESNKSSKKKNSGHVDFAARRSTHE